VLGFSVLGSAALGTDGATLRNVAIAGVASTTVVASVADPGASLVTVSVFGTGAVGALAKADSEALAGVACACAIGAASPNATIAPASAFATGAVGTLSPSEPYQAAGVASPCVVYAVAASTDDAVSSVGSATVVGAMAGAVDANATGVASAVAIGSLASATQEFGGAAGVSSASAVASVTADVSVAFGVPRIASDGVLGLWVLGDAAIGVDIPDSSPFIGVGCVGAAGGQIDAGGSGAACAAAVGSVTASMSDSTTVFGVAANGAGGDVADSLQEALAGVGATGVAAAPPTFVTIGQVAAVCAVGSCSNDESFNAPGGFALGRAGSVAVTSIPGISIVGVAATGMAGHVRSLSPSSALALWGTPVAGGAVTLAFAGLTGVAVTIGTGQTLAQVAGSLAAAVNGNPALMAAGVSASSVANVLTIRQPQPATISSSLLMTGT
jgi:hypothetical protein